MAKRGRCDPDSVRSPQFSLPAAFASSHRIWGATYVPTGATVNRAEGHPRTSAIRVIHCPAKTAPSAAKVTHFGSSWIAPPI